jgi:hypothetical protein
LITEYGTYTIQICANGDAGYSSDSEYATITYVNQRPFSGGGSYTPAPSQPTTSTTTDMATGTTTTTVTLSNGSAVSNTDSSVEIKVAEVENKVLNAAAKMARSDDNIQVLGDKENTISISAENKVSGTVQTTFEQPMKVTVPVDKKVLRDVKDTSKLTLAKVVTNTDGSVELIYMGGSYDETTGTFNAKVDEDGDYVLVEKADLVKIELNIGKTDVKHNDVTSKMDVAPKINEKDGRTELPLRYLGEALGFEIEWNNNTVTITKDDIRFDLMIGQEIPGFGKPYIESDRTMVSARYVSEMLGANVIWDPIAEQVVVVK